MKYDLSKKQTQGARRTLRAFSNALVALLEQKPFESIQVNELCQACMIPKSTFYNYFDDKYDLLNYLFQRWEEQIYPEVSQIGAPSQRAQEVLRRLLDTVEQHQDVLNHIRIHNPAHGQFCNKLYLHFMDCCYRALIHSALVQPHDIPVALVAKRNAFAIIAVFEWAFIEKHEATKEELISYIMKLLQ